jgi:1-acyl-sn-glycerol-3-phosphate acyltransferase
MSYLRSIFFSAPLVAVATIILGAVSLIASIFDRSGNALHNIARLWGRILLATGFVRVRAEGVKKLNPRGSYVFVANHGSYMDIPAALSALPHQFRFFAKKGLFKIPFLGYHLKHAGHLPVDRTNTRTSLKSMSEGARMVRERSLSVLLFPEGGRSAEGLHEFKEGAAYIAIKAGVPIVPIAIIGMRELLPMGSLHLRSGKVLVRVGDPIPTEGMTIKDRDELTERLRSDVARMMGVDITPAAAAAHPTASELL